MNLVQLNISQELGEFLEFMYGEEKGYVYSPLKNPQNEDEWERYWFEWPEDKAGLISHIKLNTTDKEVYFSPALYREKREIKENVLGSNVVWTEFDGEVPKDLGDIPPPSLRVMSSESGYEHVYWRLDNFESDRGIIERINRSICYALEADGSAWDCTQVLRPVGSFNHKHQRLPVIILSRNSNRYSPEMFGRLPDPPKVTRNISVEDLPQAIDVIAKYKWRPKDFEFFRSKAVFPARSRSLMRLGYICCELKMTDEEAFAILLNADDRWHKYSKRRDRKERLLEVINRARLKHPLEPKHEEEFPTYNYADFLATEIRIEWIVPGILQRAGHVLLSGPQGLGKTQLSLMFCQHMAIGKDFLGWQLGKPCRIIFFSMEMGHADLKYFVEQMAANFTDEEQDLLRTNFLIVPLGYGVPLDSRESQNRVNQLIKKFKPSGIIFDSLGISTEDDLSNETVAKAIGQYTARIREDHDLFVWFIHHNRKAQATNRKPNKLSDIFGSIYITAAPTTVIGLWPAGDLIEVSGLKVRLSRPFDTFYIRRTDSLGFERMTQKFTKILESQKEVEYGDEEQSSIGFE